MEKTGWKIICGTTLEVTILANVSEAYSVISNVNNV